MSDKPIENHIYSSNKGADYVIIVEKVDKKSNRIDFRYQGQPDNHDDNAMYFDDWEEGNYIDITDDITEETVSKSTTTDEDEGPASVDSGEDTVDSVDNSVDSVDDSVGNVDDSVDSVDDSVGNVDDSENMKLVNRLLFQLEDSKKKNLLDKTKELKEKILELADHFGPEKKEMIIKKVNSLLDSGISADIFHSR